MSSKSTDPKTYQENRQRDQLRRARKKTKSRDKGKSKRQKDWIPDDLNNLDTWDDGDYTGFERIMPRDENDRRRAVEQAAQQKVAALDEADNDLPDGLRGRVVAVGKGVCHVDINGQRRVCGLRGSLTADGYTNVVTVGDTVVVAEGDVVEAVLPRRSVLARPDVFYGHLQQAIVANVDQLVIVAAWRDPAIWLELIDRYLIVAARDGLPAVVCINKRDLADDEAEIQAVARAYRDLGHTVLLTSALDGTGLVDLRAALAGKISVLAGMSGVGKSSLLTTAYPDLDLRTGAVSEHSGEGRHTTTQAVWLALDDETAAVDTPGIREFGLSGLHKADLAAYFTEFEPYAPDCRFNNCTHINEPDCAVRAAVAAGDIAASRHHSYSVILDGLPG